MCFCVHVAGKHQCRALAESIYSPSEGLKEINHQLSTGVAQELIHYCNSLGQGVCDCPPFFYICVCNTDILMCVLNIIHQHEVCLSVSQMVIWIPCWIVPLWTVTSHLPYAVIRNQLKRGILKPHTAPKTHTVQRIHTLSVQKTRQALKRELQVPKTPAQVRQRG